MTEKEQLIAKAREVADRLGKTTLGRAQFLRESGIAERLLMRHFDAWSALCAQAGLHPARTRHMISDEEIFEALRLGYIKRGGVCARDKLGRYLPFNVRVLSRQFPSTTAMMEGFLGWLVATGADFPYASQVARWIARSNGVLPPNVSPSAFPDAWPSASRIVRTWARRGGRMGGERLDFRGMLRTPVNEMEVVALFVLCAQDLGFEIESLTAAFPDCLAWRRIGPGRWQQVRIEFEFLSRNFLEHDHDAKGCDLIVCWENNWGDACPLEVIVLKDEIKRLMGHGGQ